MDLPEPNPTTPETPPGPTGAWNDAVLSVGDDGLDLPAHELHLWLFSLDVPPEPIRDLASLLCVEELQRAARFVFERDRSRFVAGRAVLRTLLGRYAGVAPANVEFKIGEQGKPAISSPLLNPSIEFNLSHSAGWGLLGLARGRAVGVDIEAHREMSDAEQVAQSHFSPAETREFLAAPAGERTEAFFACWTRKEAYVKAVGRGLAMQLDRFEVSFRAGDAPRLRSICGSTAAASAWTLWNCDVGAGMSAAVVVHGTCSTIRRMSLG